MQRLLVCALIAAAGCQVDLNDPGTEPSRTQFHFPSGLAMDPTGQWLYVSNGNSDLAFSGGTVMMIDLPRFDCAVAAFKGQSNDPQCMADAVGAQCQNDPLDPMVVDCDESPFIADAVKVGNFAGNMQLRNYEPDEPGHRRLYVGVRGDPSITVVDTHADTHTLDCFDPGAKPPVTANAPACAASHQIQYYQCQGQPNCMMGDGMNIPTYIPGKGLLPTEPFGLTLDEGKLANGDPYHRLLVSHLQGGQVSIIDADAKMGDQSVTYVSNPFFPEDSLHRHGAFDLAPQHPGQGASTLWYMTSNIQPLIATFRVADVNVVVSSVNFSVAQLFSNGADLRSIVFQPDGNRMFVTENAPPSVLVFDTSPQSGPVMPGQPQATLRDVIDSCSEPSKLAMYPINWQGPAGTPPRTILRLYAMCFLANQINVIDPDRPGVDDTILVGRGPNDIVFTSTGSPRAYVTNFSEETVGLIDLQPGSPTEHRMTARIGLPVPPKNF